MKFKNCYEFKNVIIIFYFNEKKRLLKIHFFLFFFTYFVEYIKFSVYIYVCVCIDFQTK